jgi:hypothetical protein
VSLRVLFYYLTVGPSVKNNHFLRYLEGDVLDLHRFAKDFHATASADPSRWVTHEVIGRAFCDAASVVASVGEPALALFES